MTKHDGDEIKETETVGDSRTADVSGAGPADPNEQRVLAFAEQLGRIVGTIQAKAAGWMDRETLNRQIEHIRDGATNLLEQLATGKTKAAKHKPGGAKRGATRTPRGDAIDAPGKTHRRRLPSDPGRRIVSSQTAKVRAAKTMVKTGRRRGRG